MSAEAVKVRFNTQIMVTSGGQSGESWSLVCEVELTASNGTAHVSV